MSFHDPATETLGYGGVPGQAMLFFHCCTLIDILNFQNLTTLFLDFTKGSFATHNNESVMIYSQYNLDVYCLLGVSLFSFTF